MTFKGHSRSLEMSRFDRAVSGNGIIKINLLLHAFPVVTAKERNVISIAFCHRSVHDGHIVEVLQVNGLDGTC